MDIIGKLENVREVAPGRWTASCPAHDDRNPSMAVTHGDDGRLLLFCRAGCSIHDITDSLGISLSDLFPEKTILTDGKHGLKPIRRPFNAAQMLLTMGHEVNVVYVIARSIHAGIDPSNDEIERLETAISRIAKGISLAGLHH